MTSIGDPKQQKCYRPLAARVIVAVIRVNEIGVDNPCDTMSSATPIGCALATKVSILNQTVLDAVDHGCVNL
jgi:hypothetical protein